MKTKDIRQRKCTNRNTITSTELCGSYSRNPEHSFQALAQLQWERWQKSRTPNLKVNIGLYSLERGARTLCKINILKNEVWILQIWEYLLVQYEKCNLNTSMLVWLGIKFYFNVINFKWLSWPVGHC